jgi:Heterokaryon incompatibility protein (HET)
MSFSTYQVVDSSRVEIRLLQILPARKYETHLVCKLLPAYLSQKPKFEALSYMWGDEGDGTDMTLDGRPFYLRQNADSALRRLRRLSGIRTIG